VLLPRKCLSGNEMCRKCTVASLGTSRVISCRCWLDSTKARSSAFRNPQRIGLGEGRWTQLRAEFLPQLIAYHGVGIPVGALWHHARDVRLSRRAESHLIERKAALRPALVLIANDQEWSARSIESVLSPQGFAILRAFTGQQAIERALSSRPDLILLDAQLPDIHGFDVCRRLREEPAIGHSVPIIITTAGPSGRQQRLEASRAGAWDFLGQPLDSELMLARVEAFVQATSAIRRSREEALVEDETGLYTARGITRRLHEVAAEAARRRLPLACVVFTPEAIDGRTPDTAVLTGLGTALRRAGRESDVLGRLSTDEFVVVAPSTGEAGANRLAILEAVDGHQQSVRADKLEHDCRDPATTRQHIGEVIISDMR